MGYEPPDSVVVDRNQRAFPGDELRERLSDELAGSPTELGYEASEWTSERAQSHIEQTYGVTYLLGHVRRLFSRFS